jgi:hypothetical protein
MTIKSDSNQEDVEKRAKQALGNFLSPISRKPEENAWPFGRDVYRSEVYSILEGVDGVECVLELELSGLGKQGNFENKRGNVLIRNFCLVHLRRFSINVPETSSTCNWMAVNKVDSPGGDGGGGK